MPSSQPLVNFWCADRVLALPPALSPNALHFAFQNIASDETRRLLLLQNAAFLHSVPRHADSLKQVNSNELHPQKRKGSFSLVSRNFRRLSRGGGGGDDRIPRAQSLTYVKEIPADRFHQHRPPLDLPQATITPIQIHLRPSEDFHHVPLPALARSIPPCCQCFNLAAQATKTIPYHPPAPHERVTGLPLLCGLGLSQRGQSLSVEAERLFFIFGSHHFSSGVGIGPELLLPVAAAKIGADPPADRLVRIV